MATSLPSCFSIQFSEQLLKVLGNFTLLKYVKSQRSYGFLIRKELIFGFQILDLKDHFSASLNVAFSFVLECEECFSINLDLLLAINRVVSEKDLSLVSVKCISIIVSRKYSISNTVFEKRKDN